MSEDSVSGIESAENSSQTNCLEPLPWEIHKGFLWGLPATFIEILLHPKRAMQRPQIAPWWKACLFGYILYVTSRQVFLYTDWVVFFEHNSLATAISTFDDSILTFSLEIMISLVLSAVFLKLALRVIKRSIELESALRISGYLVVAWTIAIPFSLLVPLRAVTLCASGAASAIYAFYMLQVNQDLKPSSSTVCALLYFLLGLAANAIGFLLLLLISR